ncbi:MAG TPA: hypothetical protein VMR18_02920 [Candidatus Saccharimonadales bacterium]|jgi:hypothetical protein|nr:hypothetical protein [Candidatus Saccharimonadales bacterium]
MTDLTLTLKAKTKSYFRKWDSLVGKSPFAEFQPVAIGWKAKDINQFNAILTNLFKDNLLTQCHVGFVDKRYIAAAVFKNPLYRSICILKLMQRRPGSADPVGLDHVDFYAKDLAAVGKKLQKSNFGSVTNESNESHNWVSLRFSGTEVKFVDHTVLDVGVKEMREATLKLGFKPQLIE